MAYVPKYEPKYQTFNRILKIPDQTSSFWPDSNSISGLMWTAFRR